MLQNEGVNSLFNMQKILRVEKHQNVEHNFIRQVVNIVDFFHQTFTRSRRWQTFHFGVFGMLSFSVQVVVMLRLL